MSPGTLRMARLEAKACLYSLGPWPWVAAFLFLASAWVQEPGFFRQQRLDLAWPAALNTADVLSLLFISQLFMSCPAGVSRARVRLLAAQGMVALASVLVLATGLLADRLLARPTDTRLLLTHASRIFVLWPSVCLVGAGVVERQAEPIPRLGWILFAYAAQSMLFPIDIAIWERSVHSWLAVVGTVGAGSALLMSARLPSVRGDLPCA